MTARSWRLRIAVLLLFSGGGLESVRPAEIPVPARRVVSLSPNLTEIVFHLGQGEKLVGRSTACNFPAAVKNIPAVGNLGLPFVEPLLRLHPQAVLTTAVVDPAAGRILRQNHVPLIIFPEASLDDYARNLRLLGKILACETAAQSEITRVEQALQAARVTLQKPSAGRARVLVLLNWRPLITAGRKSFITELIAAAGGMNPGASEDKNYFHCSEEWVFRQRPDIIVIPSMTLGEIPALAQLPGWNTLPAVRRGQVYGDLNPDWLCRLGPRIFAGIDWLRAKISALPPR